MGAGRFSKAARVCSFCDEPLCRQSKFRNCDECQAVVGRAKQRRVPAPAGRSRPRSERNGGIRPVGGIQLASEKALTPIAKYLLARAMQEASEKTTYDKDEVQKPIVPKHGALWQRIQSSSKLWEEGRSEWKGSSRELYAMLVFSFSADDIRVFAKNPLDLSICLRDLRKQFPQFVAFNFRAGATTVFTISRAPQ